MDSVPLDPTMPALQALFPATGAPNFVAQMVEEIAGTPLNPAKAEVSYIRYRPTCNCTVLWSFEGPSGQPLLVSGLMSNEVATRVGRKSFQRSAELVKASMGERVCPYRYLPDQELLLQLYPLDVRLPGLALATSRMWIDGFFCQCTGLPADGTSVVEIVPVSYKPWRRCVLQYVVDVQGRRCRYFGKVFRDERGAPMVARLRALKAQLAAMGAPWEIATPVTYVSQARMLVLEALEDGVEMSGLLKKAVRDTHAMQMLKSQIARVADGLLSFQRTVIEGLPCTSPRDVLKEHGDELGGLVRVTPALAKSIEVQLHRLEGASSRLPPEEMVLTHGAFRYNQFLYRGNTLVALDLDAVCLSGASADAGEFLAYLDLAALRKRNRWSVVQECAEVFLASLLDHGRLDPRWIAWYRAAAHIKWARRTFFSLDPRWPELTDSLLKMAGQAMHELPV